MYCPLVFEFSVGIEGFVVGLSQISFFFSLFRACSTDGSMACGKHDIWIHTKD